MISPERNLLRRIMSYKGDVEKGFAEAT